MTTLSEMKEGAWRILLTTAWDIGHIAHVGWQIIQATSAEDVEAALQVLRELEPEDPTGFANALNERRVQHGRPSLDHSVQR